MGAFINNEFLIIRELDSESVELIAIHYPNINQIKFDLVL